MEFRTTAPIVGLALGLQGELVAGADSSARALPRNWPLLPLLTIAAVAPAFGTSAAYGERRSLRQDAGPPRAAGLRSGRLQRRTCGVRNGAEGRSQPHARPLSHRTHRRAGRQQSRAPRGVAEEVSRLR